MLSVRCLSLTKQRREPQHTELAGGVCNPARSADYFGKNTKNTYVEANTKN